MPHQQPSVLFTTILFRLRALCESQRTGIFWVLGSRGGRAEFHLRKGAIVDLRYEGNRGIGALASIRDIREGQFHFQEQEVKSFGHGVLPPTKDLLFLLGLPMEQMIPRDENVPTGEWTLERLRADAGRLLFRNEIVAMMRLAHENELSAVFFFVTTDREWYEFIFKGGEIGDVVSQSTAGFEALWSFLQIRAAKYSIRLRRCSEATDYTQQPPLPPTEELLRFLDTAGASATPPESGRPEDTEATVESEGSSQEAIRMALLRAQAEPAPEPGGSPAGEAHRERSSTPSPIPSAIRPARKTTEEKMRRQGFSPMVEILKSLHELCEEHQTGILIVVRSDKQGLLEFFLDQGRIYDIVCRRQHGREALALAKEVVGGRYSFTPRDEVPHQRAPEDLPSNEEILYQLGLPLETLGIEQTRETRAPEKAQAIQEPAPPSGQEARRSKILVVDDSALTRKIVARALLEQGYEVIEAADGETALARVHDDHPDLVILDLIMPGMDGYEVLGVIRSAEEGIRRTPVILLTSRNKLFHRIRGRMAGSDEYLTKPFKPDELLRKIRKYIG